MSLGHRRLPRWASHELIAFTLLALTALFYMTIGQPAEAELELARQANVQRVAAAETVAIAKPPASRDTLAAFYAFFDRKLTFNDWLARFYDLAERTGVETFQADYTRTVREGVGLVTYEVTLPVSGDYLKIRAFAEGVLQSLPVASLDHIAFRRQRPEQEQVDAELKFTFHLPHAGGNR